MEVQDPRAGETSLAELTGIQFGILSNQDTLALSVFERNQSIDKAKDLWDSRLGVYNLLGKDNRCCTCGAKKPSDCDGHFGHINFPMPIYNPLHIRYLKKLLSQICIVCYRYKEKKGKKVTSTAEEEAVAQELRKLVRDGNSSVIRCDSDVTKKSGHFEFPGRNGTEALSSKENSIHSKWMCDAEILTSLNGSSKYKVDVLAALKAQITYGTSLARKLHPSITPTFYNAESEPTKVKVRRKPTHGSYKPESRNESTKTHSRLEAAYMASKGQPLPLVDLSSDDDSPLAFQRTALKVNSSEQVRCSLKTSYGGHPSDDSDSSESSDSEDECKYCGAHLKNKEDRYPNLVVTLTKKNENSYETIEMKACAKEELVPLDYWQFVHGHPGGCKSTRPLVPFEALQILRCLSGEVIKKLGMHELVARPEALVLCTLPVPPSGARINEKDSSSFLTRPQMDQQHRLLQRLAVEVKRLQSSRTGKPNFATVKSEVMELQSLTSHYLTGSKWERGLKWKVMDPEVQKEDKFMKGHVLAKVNNVSARLVVFGDPSIKIEEILVPIDLVEHLTIPEKVTALSIHRLQGYVNNGPYADFFKTGAVRHDRPGRLGMSLYGRTKRNMTLVIGDTVHRHLKDGDLVIVNRPPSLTKHSLMAMRVRLHLGCAVAINPLICAPFQADFDGDTLHIFVPQSPEVLAEAHELLNISNQIINPQGGQSNAALTEDSRLGAYLLTSSCVFLDKAEMSLFMMPIFASLPVPAILKSPKGKGPLWTGQQLYSMTIPKGTQYSVPDRRFTSDAKKGILIRDGELLVCSKSSYWLEDAQGALAVVISRSLGPVTALTYLDHAQELANFYLSNRGFSVGLQDYLFTRDTHSRSRMVNRVRDDLARANREALLKTLIIDEEVQKKEVDMHPASILGFSAHMECGRSKGLYLSNAGSFREVGALDKVAISAFQTRFGQAIESLARDYCSQDNSLLVMIRAGSKGSMTKLVQQTVSLGIQLYKGEHLLPCSAQSLPRQGNLRNLSNSRVADLLQLEQGTPVGSLPGFWESRGIISNSYLDGLRPLQFFTHNIASRYGLQRAGVEQPNLLLKRLLLFLRDLHVRYDGSVCNLQGRHIVQFQYGGLLEEEGEGGLYKAIRGSKDWPDAGEAVGILAATAVTEPAYQLKLDSPHILGAKAIGPLELINETLGSNTTVKSIDRRIQLRMPWGLKNRRYGQEKGATKIQQHLKPVTLNMLTVCTKIKYRKVEQGQGDSGELRRKSPWVGHIKLSAEKLKIYDVSVEELILRLVKKHSNCLQFYASDAAASLKPCIHFFPNVLPVVATYNNQEYEDFMSAVLQTMREIMLPILLRTTVKGDERILSVNIVWEDSAWNPIPAKYPLGRHLYSRGNGELVVEVTVKDTCKTRGSAWDIVKEACIPIFRLLDWQRCTPYGIQEVNHIFGLEAALGVLQQRLGLAVAGMGKAVHLEHLKLIADSITISGSVNGAYMAGYKDLCTSLSSRRPFSNATFANCKNAFIQAAREGDMEHIEGALASSVWGKPAPLGTGSNFELLWQEKVGQELLPTVSKGVDIHKHCQKLNNLLPPEPSSTMPIFYYEEDMYVSGHPCISMQPLMKSPESKTSDKDSIRGVLGSRDLWRDISKSTQRPRLVGVNDDGLTSVGGDIREEHANSHQRFQLYRSDANGQKFEKADSWRESRKSHQRSEQPNVQVASHSVSKHFPTQPSTASFQVLHRSGEPIRETKIGAIGLSKRSTSAANLDRPASSEPKCKRIVDQATQEVDVHLRPSNANTHVSKQNHASHTQPLSAANGHHRPVSVPIKPPFNPRDDVSGDSTPSFHTPKETLETHSASSSPCSSLREILGLAPVCDENTSEGDQMSSISQPSFFISEKEVASISCATTQLARVNVVVEPKGVEACGSVSPLTERSSRRVSDEHLQHSSETSKLMASGDLLERQKEELNKVWKRLLGLASDVKNILHKRYQVGDRLMAPDQEFILDRVLYYHPDYAQKVGCGVHYIKVDRHQSHHTSRCFYVVRTDKTVCDFSYHKCIKSFANANSPALAMQYDHEIMIKPHERGNPDLDLLDSPYLDFYPSWPSLSGHNQPGCDVGLPLSPKFPEGGSGLNSPVKEMEHLELPINTCTGSRQKDESSCETSEPKTDI